MKFFFHVVLLPGKMIPRKNGLLLLVRTLALTSALSGFASVSLPAQSNITQIGAQLTAQSGTVTIPILMYHYIRINPVPQDRLGFDLSVTPQDFQQQMKYLHDNGFHAMTMADVMNAMQQGTSLPSNSVVLTFDDGYGDFASAAVPVLTQYGFKAIEYANPGKINTPNYMSLDQLHQVVGAGMIIGAHTVHHVDLPTLPGNLAQAEISDSRTQLRAITGQSIDDFAYPYGHQNASVVRMVQQAGFREAVITDGSLTHSLSQRFTLGRTRVSGGENLASFASSIHIGGSLAPKPAAPVKVSAVVPSKPPVSPPKTPTQTVQPRQPSVPSRATSRNQTTSSSARRHR